MKTNFDFKKILNKLSKNKLATNKYLLYIVALIAFLDILGYLLRKEFIAILFFYLVCLLVYCYTKNMTIVLGSGLILTSIAHFFNFMTSSVKEGMATGKKHKHKHTGKKHKPTGKKPIKEGEEATEEEGEEDTDEDNQKATDEEEQEEEEEKETYENKLPLKPGQLNIPNKEQLTKQLGEADKIEKAYDNLEKVIGENGIKSMNEGTKELVQQQKELLKGLKEVTPALNEAMGAITKIDLGNLKDIFEKTNIFNKNN